jgi:hypothetical protein
VYGYSKSGIGKNDQIILNPAVTKEEIKKIKV